MTDKQQRPPQLDTVRSNTCSNGSGEPVLGLPLDRAGTLLPADLVQGDEAIILILKPSLWYILLGCPGTLAVVAAVMFIMLAMPNLPYVNSILRTDLLMLVALLAFIRIGWQFFEWLSRVYVLTDRRVIRVAGVLRVQVFQTELRQVQHTETYFSVRERLFGLGSIGFATAGTDVPEAWWVMLRNPLAIHHKIIQAINRYR